MNDEFLRSASIIGKQALKRLSGKTVAVFGIGGVGSYVTEALVRSGVGCLYLYDNDVVSRSNINRQLVALQSTIGKYKTEIARNRCLDINPECKVVENRIFVTEESNIPFDMFDYVIDAVDNVTAKLYIISSSYEIGVPVISVMGTGNKLDTSHIRITDIYKTSVCPLAKVMRSQLKKRGIKSLDVVWSDEPPIKPDDMGEYRETGRISPGSMVFVPATAGITAASYVVKKLIEQ